MKIVHEITADEAHKLHEADLHTWLIALRDHPVEALFHIPETVLKFIRDMKYVNENNELTEEGVSCLSVAD